MSDQRGGKKTLLSQMIGHLYKFLSIALAFPTYSI